MPKSETKGWLTLSSWPADFLEQIGRYLAPNDIASLRNTGDKELTRRLTTEAIITDLKFVHRPEDLTTAFDTNWPSLTPYLRRLTLHALTLPSGGHQPWVLSLPRTITYLDFQFFEALSIWLRPVPAGNLHWSLSSEGYAPVFLCDLLPALRHLRLIGDWEFPVELDTINPLNGQQEPRMVGWSYPMRSLFVRKLPPGLESCEFNVVEPPHAHDLPSGLQSLIVRQNCARGITHDVLVQFKRWNTLNSVCNMLTGLHYDLNDGPMPSKLVSQLPLLVCLQELTGSIPASSFATLPPTLRSLICSACYEDSIELFVAKDIELLPRSLTHLCVWNCLPYGKSLDRGSEGDYDWSDDSDNDDDTDEDSQENMDTHNYEQSSHLKAADHRYETVEKDMGEVSPRKPRKSMVTNGFSSILPPALTRLELRECMMDWNLDGHLVDIGSQLPDLAYLHVDSADPNCWSLSLQSLSWVPSSLTHLHLHLSNAKNDLICTLPPPDTLQRLTTLWLNEVVLPFRLESLFFPPNLTNLTLLNETKMGYSPKILRHLPRTLVVLELLISNWSMNDLIAETPFAPPALRSIRGPTIIVNTLDLPQDLKTLSFPSLADWASQDPSRRLLPFRSPSKIKFIYSASLPSLTSLDLLTETLEDDNPLWTSCTALKHLKLRNLPLLSNIARPIELHSLQIESHLRKDIIHQTLTQQIFHSLTDIKLSSLLLSEGLDFSHLNNLTRLDLKLGKDHNATSEMLDSFIASFSETVSWLRLRLSVGAVLTISDSAFPVCRPSHLDLHDFSIYSSTLKMLNGRLTTLGLSYLHVEDWDPIMKTLPPGIEEITPLALVKALAPSITHLIQLPVIEADEVSGSIEMESIPMLGEGCTPSQSPSIRWVPVLNRGSKNDVNPVRTITCNFVASLPRSLTRWKSMSRFVFTNSHALGLPPNLTHLDLSFTPVDCLGKITWPENLTSLELTAKTSSKAHNISPSFSTSLPRRLHVLILHNVSSMADSTLKLLPADLITFIAPELVVRDLGLLPWQHLRRLHLEKIPSDGLSTLPPTLTHLKSTRGIKNVAIEELFNHTSLSFVEPTIWTDAHFYIYNSAEPESLRRLENEVEKLLESL